MGELWPSLEIIQGRLKAVVPEAMPPTPQEALPRIESLDLALPPNLVTDLIARRAAIAERLFEPRPKAGQVVQLNTVAVLLDEMQTDGLSWTGWLVSPDTDYATWWDMLLDHRDEPFDPSAGMVQVWNRVCVAVPVKCMVLAQLSEERMADVRAMSKDFVAGHTGGESDARPGFVAPRTLCDGRLVLAGTPLGDARDSRRVYQSLYAEAASLHRIGAAQVIVLPTRGSAEDKKDEVAWAEAALVGNQKKPGRQRRLRGLAAWGIVLLVLVLWILLLTWAIKPNGMLSGTPSSGSVGESKDRIVRVRFQSAAQAGRLLEELADKRMRVLDGPDANGEYLVALPLADSEQLTKLLHSLGATVSVVKM